VLARLTPSSQTVGLGSSPPNSTEKRTQKKPTLPLFI